jgi:hypothetical protein
MKSWKFWIIGLLFFGCGCDNPEQEITVFSISFPLGELDSDEEWTGDFADYPQNDSLAYGLYFNHDLLPQSVNANGETYGLQVSGNNGSDDLFMFIKRKISGFQPNTTYELLFTIRLASNAPTGAAGVGGAPGESVYLKAGASSVEPRKELQEGVYRMNIDKGNQAEVGSDMINLGHIGVASGTTDFTIITRSNNSDNSFTVTTDDAGELWIVIGTDSGFEGTTTLYYTQVDVLLNKLD